MIAILLRELIVLARRRAFAVAALATLALPAAFVLAWPTGLPLGRETELLQQLDTLERCVAAAFVTWIACRCGARERGDDLVRLAVLSAVPPSRILAARFLAHAVVIALLAFAVLPFLVYAREVTGAPTASLTIAALHFVAIGTTAAAVGLASEHLVRSYPMRWLIASAAMGAMLVVLDTFEATPADVITAALTLASFGVLAVRADRAWRYLAEEA